MNEFLSVQALGFQIEQKTILDNINFSLKKGEIATLLGASGCGKTTLLRLIAGFYQPTTGQINLSGQLIASATQMLLPEKRGIGMVFQDYALFPHLSVYQNIVFGLTKSARKTAKQQVADLLAMVGLSGYEKRYPHELSGGEQQRVAIARALLPNPSLLLLDEPFASLDANLREHLVQELGALFRQLSVAVILVTHDQREAFAISDVIGLMHQGHILQWASPETIYHYPNSARVAHFIGKGIQLTATVLDAHRVSTALGEVVYQTPHTLAAQQQIEIFLRPEDIIIDANSPLRAKVLQKSFHGARTLYTLAHANQQFNASFSALDAGQYALGDEVSFAFSPHHLIAFAEKLDA